MKASPIEIFLENLEQAFPRDSLYYMPKEQAYEELKQATGVDFGDDVVKWKQSLQHKKKSEKKSNRLVS